MKINRSVLVIGVILRIIIGSISYHPDIKSQHFHTQYLFKGVTNIYDYISVNKNNLPYTDTFNYPPLAYLFLGTWTAFGSVIFGDDFNFWLNDWSSISVQNKSISSYLLFLKTPYLLVDVILFYGVIRLIRKDKVNSVSIVWAFNPVSLYGIYAIGQFDILPAMFTFLSLLLFMRRKILLAGLILGISISFKIYPILLVPLFLIYSKNLKNIFLYCLSIVMVWGVSVLPLIQSDPFREIVFRSQLGLLLFERKISLLNLSIPLFIIAYVLILLLVYFARKSINNLILGVCLVLVSIVTFTNFHPQWMVWSIPFILVCVFVGKVNIVTFLSMTVLYFILSFSILDQYLGLAMFSTINFGFTTVPSIPSLIPSITNYSQMLRNVFILLGLASIKNLYKND